MSIWWTLGAIAIGAGWASVAMIVWAARAGRGHAAWAGYGAEVIAADDDAWRRAHVAAVAPTAVGAVIATALVGVGWALHDGGPASALWTLAALIVVGLSLLVGSSRARRAAVRDVRSGPDVG